MKKSFEHITENFLTIDLLLEINNGYCISHQVPIDFSSGFVLAYNDRIKEFVTWEYRITNKETYCNISFFHGHYISKEITAKKDFYNRIYERIEYIIDWYKQKREYDIRNDIDD